MIINDGIGKISSDIDSFLMIGQSNMAGRGEFGEVEDIKNDLCYMLRNGRWQQMSEPINPDRPIFEGKYHSGISLAASFADEYAKFFNKKIGLIPCADGGTKISEWMPTETLFQHAVMQSHLAMKSSNLKGIIWHQGESDCNEEHFDLYEERILAMMTELRKQLNNMELPIIMGEISEKISDDWHGINKYAARFNEQLPGIAKQLGNCMIVSSKDLELKPDGIHFNSASCREFGKRYFAAYVTIQSHANL